MDREESLELTKCPACDGRGYFYCDCHPADCICGVGEETCDECGGEGIIDPSHDYLDAPSPQPNLVATTDVAQSRFEMAIDWPPGETHSALRLAIEHIEHMAAFIGSKRLGYAAGTIPLPTQGARWRQ